MHTPPTSPSTSLLWTSPAVGISSRACRALNSPRIEAPSPASRHALNVDDRYSRPNPSSGVRSQGDRLLSGSCFPRAHARTFAAAQKREGRQGFGLEAPAWREGPQARQTQRVPGRGPRAIPKAGSALKKKGSLLHWQLAFRRSRAPH